MEPYVTVPQSETWHSLGMPTDEIRRYVGRLHQLVQHVSASATARHGSSPEEAPTAQELLRCEQDQKIQREKQFQEHRQKYKRQCCRLVTRPGGLPQVLEAILPEQPPAVYATFQQYVYHAVVEAYFFCKQEQKCAAGHLEEVYRRCPDLQLPDPVRTLVLATHPRLGAGSPAQSLPPEVLRHIDSFLPTQRHLLRTVAVAANFGFTLYTD